MHSITIFLATDPYYAKSPASLSTIAMNASNILFATATKPASLQIPAATPCTKRCLDNNFLSCSHSYSLPSFPITLINCPRPRLFVIAQTITIASYLPLLSQLSIHSTIDPIFSLRHFHFIYIFVTLQSLCKSATNIFVIYCPTPPQNLQIPSKYLNLTILNLIFYLFNAIIA